MEKQEQYTAAINRINNTFCNKMAKKLCGLKRIKEKSSIRHYIQKGSHLDLGDAIDYYLDRLPLGGIVTNIFKERDEAIEDVRHRLGIEAPSQRGVSHHKRKPDGYYEKARQKRLDQMLIDEIEAEDALKLKIKKREEKWKS